MHAFHCEYLVTIRVLKSQLFCLGLSFWPRHPLSLLVVLHVAHFEQQCASSIVNYCVLQLLKHTYNAQQQHYILNGELRPPTARYWVR